MVGDILIVDDEKDMLTLLKRIITEDTRHKVVTQCDPFAALELFKEKHFDLVITDFKMPKMDGIRFLDCVKKLRPDVSVVIITAFATIDNAVTAIRKGAHDYITKPFKGEEILLTIEKVMQLQNVVRENQALRQALDDKKRTFNMLGSSRPMLDVFDRIKKVSPTTATVLITGSSGTGKELVAIAIHKNSLRSAKKIIIVNCAAIPENVLESELFGHVKGAFTGAWKDTRGLVAEAHEGTLFLDEIGDLSPLMQTKILRLVQEGEYKPVGSVTTKKADLRIIAATNSNLKSKIREKTFREDLYYRLNVIHFELPPLKARKSDIPLLAHSFMKKFSSINAKNIQSISPAATQALMSHDYPGNVRELENVMERAVIYCGGDTLELKDLFFDDDPKLDMPDLENDGAVMSFRETKEKMIEMFHRQYIQTLLAQSQGNISRAAQIAGIQRQYLHRLMKETGVAAVDFKEKA